MDQQISPSIIEDFIEVEGLRKHDLQALQRYLSCSAWSFNKELVNVREFLESPHYMNAKGILYPTVLESLIELNEGEYDEAVLTGGIGSGKSTLALYTQAYQLYLLSCYRNPQEVFGLDPSSEIVIIFQSVNERLAKCVDFERFKAMISSSNYFRNHFMFDRNYDSELRFPNRIIVKPVVGLEIGSIGQNVISGIIDEVNFMNTIDNSKRSVDEGTYDQAVALYNSISRRRKSRFMAKGKLPGILCLVSSKRYPGQFTDQMIEESRKQLGETGKTSIYIYDKRVWDIKPDAFNGERFHLFVGDETRKPRILEEHEEIHPKDRELTTSVPVEYKSEFEKDIMNALRDIAGKSTLAVHPFIMDTEALAECFGTHQSILNTTVTDFTNPKLAVYPGKFVSKESPRFVHVDLALTGDSAGIVMGFVPKFSRIDRGKDQVEILPLIQIDFSLEVRPPKGGEIIFSKIRESLYKLRELGLNIKWVTFDGYQSADCIQILRQKGFLSDIVSVDKSSVPYEFAKSALYDRRVRIPDHPKLLHELRSLEKDAKTGKIDHPIRGGSKDIADSLAGVIYGLTRRREIWVMHEIPLNHIPDSIKTALVRGKTEPDVVHNVP